MNSYQIPSGVWTAIITPFLPDGEIDWKSFSKLVEKQLECRIKGLVICGTTGEASTLTIQEKLALIKRVRALAKDLPIMAGVGSSNTNQTVELSKLAIDAGADYLLVITPPYVKPTLSGLLGHYNHISAATHKPICLYHVPSRTAHSLTPDQLSSIANIPEVCAIKEASGNMAFFSQAQKKCHADFFAGDDFTFLPSLAIGGSGVISVISNLYPEIMVAMHEAFQNCHLELARSYHNALIPMFEALFYETNPGPLKAALSTLGFCENILRLPLAPVTFETYESILSAMQAVKHSLKLIK